MLFPLHNFMGVQAGKGRHEDIQKICSLLMSYNILTSMKFVCKQI